MTTLWAVLLVVTLPVGWALTLFGLPGNWIIAGVTALYVYLVPAESSLSIGWPVIVVLAGLAALAELAEFLAGALGVAKAGGSRRSAVMALVGSLVGSLVGFVLGLPVPVIGSMIAVVLCASLGALAGAMLGEDMQGRDPEASWKVGVAAFWGRLLGTLAKTVTAAVMAAVVIAALIYA